MNLAHSQASVPDPGSAPRFVRDAENQLGFYARNKQGVISGVAVASSFRGAQLYIPWQHRRDEAERLVRMMTEHGWLESSGGPRARSRSLVMEVAASHTRARGVIVRLSVKHNDECGWRVDSAGRFLSPWMEVRAPWEMRLVDDMHALRSMILGILNESV